MADSSELKRADHWDAGRSPRPGGVADNRRRFIVASALLILAFAVPLWHLIRFAAASELYSYILLIPFISLYLVWLKRRLLSPDSLPVRGVAALFLAAGSAVIVAYWAFLRFRVKLPVDDYLAVMMIAFLLFFFGICVRYLGRENLRRLAFPLGFLIFMVPIPMVAIGVIDSFLQAGSAAVAEVFFTLAGTSFLRNGLVFQLPNITIQIAPECSGIHSSLVLFIVSLLAGYVILHSPWRRAVFILVVIPLALLRNGFRVFTIGELCVHFGPHMIDSPIHHRGGPLFFALSLIPLFLLLLWLKKSELARGKAKSPAAG